jgi:hypothetical protein
MTAPDTQRRRPAAPKKLTRAQISAGLDQFPVEHLLSAGKGKTPQLTHKQREFARNVAMGKTKAQAYRDAYKEDAAPNTLRVQPYVLASDDRIAKEVEAYKLAIEAEKHRTPVQLKALLVQQLVQHSLDGDFPPAQRVQCLKLLGSLFEVGAFVERKEVTTVSRSGDIRARIMETLKDVTDVQAIDAGLDLLDELAQAKVPAAAADGAPPFLATQDDPTTPPPGHTAPAALGCASHTIPHEGSPEKSDSPLPDGDEK